MRLRTAAITTATAVALIVVPLSSSAQADTVKPATKAVSAAKATAARVSTKKVSTKQVPAKKTATKPKVATTPAPTPTPTVTPTVAPTPSPYLYPQPTDIVSVAPAQHTSAAAVIEFVKTQLGKSYKLGGVGPMSYDCSGLMLTAWKNVGVELPRTSGQQYLATIHIKLEDIQPGDLIFFGKAGNRHVGLYMGDNKVLDAASPTRGVTYSDLNWAWYTQNFAGVGRIPAP